MTPDAQTTERESDLSRNRLPRSVSILSLVSLVLGFGLGIVAHGHQGGAMDVLGGALAPLGGLWVNALRAVVIPLVVSFVISVVAAIGEARKTGGLVVLSFLTFMGLVALAGVYSVTLGYFLAAGLSVDPEVISGLRSLVSEGTAATASTAVSQPASIGQTISRLIPPNLFQAAVDGQLLSLVIASVVFGLALSQLEEKSRDVMTGFFKAVADASMVVVIWILWVMPLAVFSLAYAMAEKTGWEGVSALGYWVFGASAILSGFVLILYPVAGWVGKVRIRDFARAVGPAQLVAAGSRSSLACIPVLLEGAQRHLRVPESLRGFVIPLSSASFKLSGPLGSPFQLFILAKLYGIPLDPATVAVFVLGIMLMSFGTPGIPSGGFSVRLPFFLAAGIPLEGFVLTTALDAIPDIFKTMVNVTGDMTALTIVGRFAGVSDEGSDISGEGS